MNQQTWKIKESKEAQERRKINPMDDFVRARKKAKKRAKQKMEEESRKRNRRF